MLLALVRLALTLRLKQDYCWIGSPLTQFVPQAHALRAQRLDFGAMIPLGVEVEFVVQSFASFHGASSGCPETLAVIIDLAF